MADLVYHVEINSITCEVKATTTQEAITIAVEQYVNGQADEPDGCDFDATTQGICLCASLAGELKEAAPVE